MRKKWGGTYKITYMSLLIILEYENWHQIQLETLAK